MTVKELIENLQRFDGELPVFVKVPDEAWPLPVKSVTGTEIENTEFVQIYAYDD